MFILLIVFLHQGGIGGITAEYSSLQSCTSALNTTVSDLKSVHVSILSAHCNPK